MERRLQPIRTCSAPVCHQQRLWSHFLCREENEEDELGEQEESVPYLNSRGRYRGGERHQTAGSSAVVPSPADIRKNGDDSGRPGLLPRCQEKQAAKRRRRSLGE
jgi:hypothetical protein